MPDMKQIPLEARQQPKKEMIKTDIELTRNLKVCELTNAMPNMQRLSLKALQ
jgi:hypothetical protein